MSKPNIESAVIRLGDVGVCIDMVDAELAEGRPDRAERAVLVLKEIFDTRYLRLQSCLYGGEQDVR